MVETNGIARYLPAPFLSSERSKPTPVGQDPQAVSMDKPAVMERTLALHGWFSPSAIHPSRPDLGIHSLRANSMTRITLGRLAPPLVGRASFRYSRPPSGLATISFGSEKVARGIIDPKNKGAAPYSWDSPTRSARYCKSKTNR
jgi:hypothetical protein